MVLYFLPNMLGILILLGPFRFSLATAAPDEITRASAWTWAEIERIGSAPAMQFIGERAELISIRGRIIPGFTGGVEQLAQMRALAGLGIPMFLVDGMGRVHGNWVIESLTDSGGNYFSNGSPRIVDFDLAIKKYNDGTGIFGKLTKASKLISLFR
jgi:phage protein U